MFTMLHPVVRLLFFAGVIILPVFLSDPVFSMAAIVFAVAYQAMRKGKRCLSELVWAAAVIVLTALGNLLFNHLGMTVLFTLFSNELTLESLLYGIAQGMSFAAVLLWFTVLSETTDSERVLYLLRFLPKTALVFSMVLGFIPRFRKKARDIREARLALNGGERGDKKKNAFADFGALLNYALEGSIITAEAMEARGYRPEAIRFRRFRMKGNDAVFLTLIVVLIIVSVVLRFRGTQFVYEPTFKMELHAGSMLCPSLLAALPFIVTLWEDVKWKHSRVKE